MSSEVEKLESGLPQDGHRATDGLSGPVVLGEGDFKYEVSGKNWGQLPDGWNYKEATSVAADANDRIYVGGGQKNSSSYLQSIEAFDFKDNRWISAGSLPEPLGAADSVVVDGKVYLVAGSGPSSNYSKKVYAADISGPKDLYIRISSQESE